MVKTIITPQDILNELWTDGEFKDNVLEALYFYEIGAKKVDDDLFDKVYSKWLGRDDLTSWLNNELIDWYFENNLDEDEDEEE